MILGVGVDIVEVARIETAIKRHGQRFLKRVFTEREIEYCLGKGPAAGAYFAGKFAGKEAFVKAIGTGIAAGVRWRDVEILNDPAGKPYLAISGAAREKMEQLGARNAVVSISHTKNYAVAVAILED